LQELLAVFESLGAYKVSFLGGEPTLYRDPKSNKKFTDVLQACKTIGYKYVRFDTNGQFAANFLEQENLKFADEITFSLDGFNRETNDVVRGKGSFDRCLSNISTAVRYGYKVQITMCVHKDVCPSVKMGINNIEKMISFAESLGVSAINFHPILKVGIARDNWIDNTNISPDVWMMIYRVIQERNSKNAYSISVRLPMRFVDKSIYDQNIDKFSYCPLQLAERALIMPDGTIKVCAFTIGTPYHIADYDESTLALYTGEYSEYSICKNHNSAKSCESNCLFQKTDSNHFVPLCMSFKPHQKEIVWNELISEV
jgi:sulfatase maturation enzyme AslB (radical SAM superfamily)